MGAEQLVTVNGSITTTITYVAGGLEEIASNAVDTTLTKYFTGANGLPTAERVGTNGPLSYLATDGQGRVSTSLDSVGNVTSSQLYTPYGNSRYTSGSSPTSMGYTGQRADSTPYWIPSATPVRIRSSPPKTSAICTNSALMLQARIFCLCSRARSTPSPRYMPDPYGRHEEDLALWYTGWYDSTDSTTCDLPVAFLSLALIAQIRPDDAMTNYSWPHAALEKATHDRTT